MIDDTQPDMELLRVVTFVYPISLKAGGSKSHLQTEFNSSTQHCWILCAVLNFSLKS